MPDETVTDFASLVARVMTDGQSRPIPAQVVANLQDEYRRDMAPHIENMRRQRREAQDRLEVIKLR